jgi:hypothetical protein
MTKGGSVAKRKRTDEKTNRRSRAKTQRRKDWENLKLS